MRYEYSESGQYVIKYRDDGTVTSIPVDPENADYAGLLASGVAIEPYTEPGEAPPEEISDRQFFQGLAIRGLISEDEALAAVKTGELPALIGTFVSALPAKDRFAARMALCGATIFQRSHPFTVGFGAAAGMTPEDIDDLWRECSRL